MLVGSVLRQQFSYQFYTLWECLLIAVKIIVMVKRSSDSSDSDDLRSLNDRHSYHFRSFLQNGSLCPLQKTCLNFIVNSKKCPRVSHPKESFMISIQPLAY